MALTKDEGTALVRLARNSLDSIVAEGRQITRRDGPPFLEETRGAFVTLKRVDGSLRGCIGFPYPVKPLGDAVLESAVNAAVHDYRFSPVQPRELEEILVEVSALTRPERLEPDSPKRFPELVRIGLDGLIISGLGTSGLLLPQVATEYGFKPAEFLSETCLKAGLMPDAWLTDKVIVQRFQAEIFAETSPRGEVARELD